MPQENDINEQTDERSRKAEALWQQPFEIRGSRIQGSGAFATRAITTGEIVAKYSGEIIEEQEAYSRYEDDGMVHHHTFLFSLTDGRYIDAGVGGNDARFINHSCDPNSEAFEEDGQVMVRALRDIAVDEEITYDYRLERDGKPKQSWKRLYACHCGAKNCRGTMLINFEEPAKKKKKGKGKKKDKGKDKKKGGKKGKGKKQ